MPVNQPAGSLILSSLFFLSISSSAVSAVIECRDESGRRHFSQFRCPLGTHLQKMPDQTPGNLSIVASIPLSEAEQRALRALERSLEAERQARARNHQKAAGQRKARAQEDKRRCDDALEHLKALADTRRRGYAASAEARLEAEEARWRATKKLAC